MKIQHAILFLILILLNGCIVQFIPETDDDKELLVVEGLITNKKVPNIVKLSKSLPLGMKNLAKPLKGCTVTITDNAGHTYTLKETTTAGTYATDPLNFTGVTGRFYTLHVNTKSAFNNLNFESIPMEMKPVPEIENLFYEKELLSEGNNLEQPQEGCQIYINTSDPTGKCRFYRWEYSETWEFRLPYEVPNRVCYITNNSGIINVKNTTILQEDRINRYPLNFISNSTDRLKFKYSILVNQYSLNEDEYQYWEKLQTISENIGGLYDITPSSIPSNIWCTNNPAEKVLGYFSVSAASSKRLFIKDYFSGIINLYNECATDTVPGLNGTMVGLNVSYWLIEDHTSESSPYKVFTDSRACADCTTRGTTVKPSFWDQGK
jgi:hypothetical protein